MKGIRLRNVTVMSTDKPGTMEAPGGDEVVGGATEQSDGVHGGTCLVWKYFIKFSFYHGLVSEYCREITGRGRGERAVSWLFVSDI